MLGSAIPKRWISSLALVGLVFLFVAMYSAVWVSPASAGHTTGATTTTVAEAPLSVTAVAGDEQATVSWTAPGDNHGAAITSYMVGASPGGQNGTTNGSTLSIVITGLTNGTAYTFGVVAVNSAGNSVNSSPSNSVTPVDVPTGSVLTNLLASSVLNLSTGEVVGLDVSPVDENGAIDLNMPSVVYTWTAGNCGTLSSTSVKSPVFTAGSSSCSSSITVSAKQGNSASVPSPARSIAVNVSAPPAAVVVPDPVDPAVTADIVISGVDSATILPSVGGTFSLPSVGDAPPISISVPSGAIDGVIAAVNVSAIDASDVPPPPLGASEGATSGAFKFGSTIIEIQWYDDGGNALDSFQLDKPAQVCVPFTTDDVDGAHAGQMSIWRFNGTVWVELNSTVNFSAGTVCAYTSNFSSFALGLAVAPPQAAATGLPVTGGFAPSAMTLMLAMLAGLALVGTGVFTARRARRVRENS